VVKPLETNDAREFFASCRALIDAELDRLIPKEAESPERVHAAIRWSVFAGGKRFRPALLIAVGRTFGACLDHLLRTACAFEMIHTYSLIHDDLPSMDDDDLRRGRATCHVQFDEATAILAGDALQALAFQTIADDEKLSSDLRIRLISELGRAAGVPGVDRDPLEQQPQCAFRRARDPGQLRPCRASTGALDRGRDTR